MSAGQPKKFPYRCKDCKGKFEGYYNYQEHRLPVRCPECRKKQIGQNVRAAWAKKKGLPVPKVIKQVKILPTAGVPCGTIRKGTTGDRCDNWDCRSKMVCLDVAIANKWPGWRVM